MAERLSSNQVRFVSKSTIEENMMAHRTEIAKRGTASAAPAPADGPEEGTQGGATKDAGSASAAASSNAASSASSPARPLGGFENEAAGAIKADGGKSASYDFNQLFGVEDPPVLAPEPEPAKDDGAHRHTLGDGRYSFEPARSSQSKCKGCYELMEKGTIRVATPGGYRGAPKYFHIKCAAAQINKKLSRAYGGGPAFPLEVVASCLKHFSGLSADDKKVLEAAKAARQSEAPGKNKRKHGQ